MTRRKLIDTKIYFPPKSRAFLSESHRSTPKVLDSVTTVVAALTLLLEKTVLYQGGQIIQHAKADLRLGISSVALKTNLTSPQPRTLL